jgi:acyl-[acyl-carrier-protein]-phospholipid O-acyltransferase/long-chain-fatty-acid--[acyl-carrier-protein] ligase
MSAEKSSLRGFWSLFVTQFQGAFSDNAFKTLVIFIVVGDAAAHGGRDLVLVIGALFAVPFVLFSMTGGYLADRYSKRSVTIGTKVFEIGVMTLALVGLASGSLTLKIVAVVLMSVQSALFGPSKYGLLPELLPEKLLSWGNGVLGLGTFLAIITGTIAGGLMAEGLGGTQEWSGVILVGLAVGGLLVSLGITRVAAANPQRNFRVNFLGDLWSQIRLIRTDRVLWLAVLGNTYFYFLASLLQFNILFYGIEVLHVSETKNSLLMATVAIGIGLGNLAAGYLSGNKIEYGLIPLGSLGLTAFGSLLFLDGLTYGQVGLLLALMGFSAGFFIVPISALIQRLPPDDERGGVIAASNLLSFVGIFLSSVVYFVCAFAGLYPKGIFLASAALTVGATVYVVIILPDALLRLFLWLLTHTIYRVRVEGRDNIPARGGALFVCNHLSFVDALMLIASTDRFIRFIMDKSYYDHPILKPFARIMQAIPISSQQRPKELLRSLNEARDSIQEGDVVCIFAEGQMTRIGQLLPFRRGFERIMKGVDAPIIPVHLAGVWGSIFSYERRRFLWKLPRRLLAPITVSYGKPLPGDSSPTQVRQAVQLLYTEAYRQHSRKMKPLNRQIVSACRQHPLRFAMADGRVPKLRFFGALTRTLFLAGRLKSIWAGQEMVGILLPPSVGGALANFAALLLGKVPVNLNYTTSDEVVASCAEQCQLKTVITSREFLEHIKIEVPTEPVFLEEVAADPQSSERVAALILAWLAPVRVLEKLLGVQKKKGLDDLATVIFSSGSTGTPKGVMLSHYNIGSNIEQLTRTFSLGRGDRILGILPFFHSFGFTGTLLLPVVQGIGVVFHPNPLDARVVGALVAKYAATFLLATPTFLQGYTRRCEPEQFGSLDFVMTGAEKLQERVALAFEDKFGIRPLEGYGCTECSPVVSVNTKDFRAAGFLQIGAKRQTIGHPLPGISARILDPDTGEELPPGEPGLLLVKGPNVMLGYLGQPEKTNEVLKDGWYVTGDIASQDEDGFLKITDRLSRFSKIGGEMVPHVRVEEVLQDLAGVTEQCFAVAGVPNKAKGERLVVLHTLSDGDLRACLEKLSKADLPKLWTPRANQFHQIEALPYLGTGKLDLRKVKELALARMS